MIPRTQIRGLIEATYEGVRRATVQYGFRGLRSAASLKRDQPEQVALPLRGFRGLRSAASLKPSGPGSSRTRLSDSADSDPRPH